MRKNICVLRGAGDNHEGKGTICGQGRFKRVVVYRVTRHKTKAKHSDLFSCSGIVSSRFSLLVSRCELVVLVGSRRDELGKEERVGDDFHLGHTTNGRSDERDHHDASPKANLILRYLKLCEGGHSGALQ